MVQRYLLNLPQEKNVASFVCDEKSNLLRRGLNFKIGHFLHLKRVKKEKVTLRYVMQFKIQPYLLNLSRERMLRQRSALKKKAICR